MGSDTSPVNIYLLREKYNIEVAEFEGIVFRRYNGSNINRRGYGFPISPAPFDLNGALNILEEDSLERGEVLSFCLCDEKQVKAIDKFRTIDWKSFGGDGDYIYSRESLSRLSGKKLHRKKNHVNRFMRIYPESQYLPLTPERLPDALKIAELWLVEHDDGDISVQREFQSIKEAAENWDKIGMSGGVLYADGEPAAMTMFSVLSPQCLDVHFEKATDKFAADGAFAVVNQCMVSSKEAANYIYINREEDMGIPGLQKAKESYQPDFKLKKYYGKPADM